MCEDVLHTIDDTMSIVRHDSCYLTDGDQEMLARELSNVRQLVAETYAFRTHMASNSNRSMKSSAVFNDVDVIEDKEAGVTTFRPVKHKLADKAQQEHQEVSMLQKAACFFKKLIVKPYVKCRDLADPLKLRTDADVGSDRKSAVEVGLQIGF